MEKPLYEEALEQLAAWHGRQDPHAPVQICDRVVVDQARTCVIGARCIFMTRQQPPPHGFDGIWLGMATEFECSPSEVSALVAGGAEDNRSALARKVAGLRDAHIQKHGSVPRVVRISRVDEEEWFAHGVPDSYEAKFKREGRSAVAMILDMSVEWDAPTTAVQ